ncbi:MAG: ABC transporter permease [Gammaproteobacteria bacterium]|nr:ABC transporter permease [Gammaproteobacteria bacterium]MBU2056896.1 ABC transporter permease [Gammaproteobacteria bacterium]MBU2174572.1 ABC transporter permease [Gammaproteobacteria bacterium]MBU2248264.1 ABC transporter permease [Gammaproteobacteria bacterium]MBU2343731.1 ABC transporter permease [Gammaproteobacteria bacterium]
MLNSLPMLGNYLTTGLRAVLRHKTHLALNLLGLTIGLASALLILLYASYELGYDKMHPNASNSHRLEQFFVPVNQRFPVSSPAMKAVLENYDARIRVTRINSGAPALRLADSSQQLTLEQAQSVDANITDFFHIDVLQGDLVATLSQPNQIALSEQEALRLFGTSSVLSQQLQLGEQRYTISAVYRMPEQSHFQAGSLRRISDEIAASGMAVNNVYSYISLPTDIDKTAMLLQLTSQLNKQTYEGQNIAELQLRALTDIHLYSSLAYEFKVNGSAGTVHICLFLAALLLLIAAINFINMSTARAAVRAKEVGVRKALGASRSQLFVQFMLESLLIACSAGLLAAVTVELVLPHFNLLVNRTLYLDYAGNFGLILLSSVLSVGMLAGVYPAVFISAFDAKKVLSGDFQRGNTAIWLRKGLLVLQGAITIGLLVSSVVLQQQLQLLQDQPTGYKREARLLVNGIDNSKLFGVESQNLIQSLYQIDGVNSVSILDTQLTDTISQAMNIQLPGQTQDTALPPISQIGTGFDIVKTAGLTLLAGRDFSNTHQSDWYQIHKDHATAAVIITESLARKAGYSQIQDVIGQEWLLPGDNPVLRMQVVGVVADIQIGSAFKQQEPVMLICGRSPMTHGNVIVSTQPEQATSVRTQIQHMLSDRLQRQDLKLSWLNDDYNALYQNQQRQGKVIAIFAALAIALTCVGLFGLAAFSAEQRSREVAMRKVLGAGRFNLVNLLASEYIKLMSISALLAIPATFWALHNWLNEFSVRINQSPWLYLLAAAATFAICWCTVASLAWQVAGRKPAMVLRQQ